MDDPFRALGLTARFDLDPGGIRAALVRAAVLLHPDRQSDDIARASAVREMAALTEAAAELRDPIRRAQALLRLAGHACGEAAVSPSFLAEVLDLQEASGEAAVDQVRGIEREAHEATAGGLAALLAAPSAPGAEAIAQGVREALARWRYARRLLARLGAPGEVA